MLSEREGLQLPADLYLEGSDQHRGQLSLQADLAGTYSLAQSATGRASSMRGPHSNTNSSWRPLTGTLEGLPCRKSGTLYWPAAGCWPQQQQQEDFTWLRGPFTSRTARSATIAQQWCMLTLDC